MLRRRGVDAAILAGVSIAKDRSLNAHAWVDSALSEYSKKDQAAGSYTVVMRIGPEVIDQ